MPAHLAGEEGPSRGLILNLEEGEEWVIGRDPDEAEFVIEDSTVSRRHARLTHAPEGIYLENLSRISPTLINDEPVEGHVLLKEGDRIQIGRSIFLFSNQEISNLKTPQKKKQPGGYDDIFGSLEDPSEETLIPTEEKVEETILPPSLPNAYDTIFEDSEEEPEIPFHLLPDTPLLLKVIAGPNAGAEIGLEKGKIYTIGKDPLSSDIIFQDMSVSRRHARIEILPDGTAEIEDLGSKNGTVVNGVPITEKMGISTQDLIALGTTVFLIIDRDAPQETIYSPMPASYEAPKAVVEEVVAAIEKIPELEAEEKDWKKTPIPPKYLFGAASIAAICLIVFISFFSLFKTKGVEIAAKDPTSLLKKALTKFEGVQFSFNPASGKLFLVGHVLTGVQAQEMVYRIGEFDFVMSTENNVVIDELVDKMMNDLLSSNPNFRGATIQSFSPGRFILSGYVDTNAEAMSLSEYLSVNFPYLDRLESQLAIGENLDAQIQNLLQTDGLGSVTFQFSNGEVILSGNYSNKLEKPFADLIKQISMIPGVRGVRNYAIPSHPNQAAIDLSQQYQVTGTALHEGHGYSAILNGKVYIVGDFVSAMRIAEIDPHTILLEKDGIKYRINYTR